MSAALTWWFLLGSGLVAGVIGTSGGITSMVAYPALLAAGLSPFDANMTCSVALLGSGISSSLRAGPDLAGHRASVLRWMPIAVVFSLAGAALLLLTPSHVFDAIVPFLVAAGALILLLQPRITAWQSRRGRHLATAPGNAAGAGVALYNGYFGAGSGILMIALLLLTTEPTLHRANSLKNVVLVAADLLPALLFALAGHLVWRALWPVGIGSLAGGLIGPAVARRVHPGVLRVLIALSGFGLAVWLLLGR